MKSIEELERLGAEELERIASESGVTVPKDLNGKILGALTAVELTREKRKRKVWKFALAPAALVLAAALTVGINYLHINAMPVDTFSNPEEAYAQLEATFSYISGKVTRGVELADAARPEMVKASETLSKFHKNSE